MESAVRALLEELAAFGRDNDARETDRERRMLNITPDTGRLLAILVRSMGARRLLEIGTSNGYSTIWLAWAANDTDGHVISVDRSGAKLAMARENLGRAGLAHHVTAQHSCGTSVGPQHRGQDPHGSRLTGPVRAEEAEDGSRGHVAANAVEGDHLTEALPEVSNGDDVVGHALAATRTISWTSRDAVESEGPSPGPPSDEAPQ